MMYNYPFGSNTPIGSGPSVYSQPTQLIKVTGLDSAKAYPTFPNSTIALFDSDEDIMYIKSTDANNFPTIRIFSFTEVHKEKNSEESNKYVTVEEFNKFKEELLNGKQFVRNEKYRKPNTASRNESGAGES